MQSGKGHLRPINNFLQTSVTLHPEFFESDEPNSEEFQDPDFRGIYW